MLHELHVVLIDNDLNVGGTISAILLQYVPIDNHSNDGGIEKFE
jgi:hypothetical protein